MKKEDEGLLDHLVEDIDPVVDKKVTYSVGDQGYQASPRQILMTAGRMLRDGWSLRRIRAELSIASYVTDRELERACRRGLDMLVEAIAKGEEPEESEVRASELHAKQDPQRPTGAGLILPGDPRFSKKLH